MAILGKLTFRNFFATGDKPVVINLNNGWLTLISGDNGVGKSTIIDALVYVLYGSTHRKDLTVPELINEVNMKRLLVTLEVTNGNNKFEIRRGQKPKILEIIKNGVPMDQLSSIGMINKYIISNIIGQDKDLFLQLTVIGKSNYKPPLELTTPKRRELVENLFNLFVLSKMKEIVKDKFKELNKDKDQIKIKIDKKNTEIEYTNKLIIQAEENKQDNITELSQEITKLESSIKKLENEYKHLKFDDKKCSNLEKSLRDIRKNERTLNRAVGSLESTLSLKQGVRSSYDEECPLCPTCGQKTPIQDHTVDKKAIEEEISNIKDKISKNKTDTDECQINAEINKKLLDELLILKVQKSNTLNNIRVESRNLEIKKSKLEELEKPVDIDVDIEKLKKELEELEFNLEITIERLKYFKYFKDDFLSDTGFKTYVLSQFLPEIRKSVNTLISEYGLSYKVKVLDDFTFDIYNIRNKKISYARLSEGQKQRMNLAVWESFMNVVKSTRNVQTNLIIFDEILDGSLDKNGQVILVDSVKEKIDKNGMTGFIISHGMDGFFEETINVSLKNEFSQYEMEK